MLDLPRTDAEADFSSPCGVERSEGTGGVEGLSLLMMIKAGRERQGYRILAFSCSTMCVLKSVPMPDFRHTPRCMSAYFAVVGKPHRRPLVQHFKGHARDGEDGQGERTTSIEVGELGPCPANTAFLSLRPPVSFNLPTQHCGCEGHEDCTILLPPHWLSRTMCIA